MFDGINDYVLQIHEFYAVAYVRPFVFKQYYTVLALSG